MRCLQSATMKTCDVLVRGGGIVGQSLALALSRLGLQVAMQGDDERRHAGPDVRAYALNAASAALLQGLKVWDALPPEAKTAVHDMHVEGDAGRATIEFSAWEQRVGELAWIVDAAALERELGAAIRFAPHVEVTPEEIEAPLVALC